MRRLCPMSRNRQSSELGKKATDSGHEDPGSLRRGTDWRDLNGVLAGPRQSPPRQNTSMGFARACPSKAIPGWKRRHFGRFPLAPVPVGIQGWGSTRRSSPTRDGTSPESCAQGAQPPSSKSRDNREQTNPKLQIPRERATTDLQTGGEMRVEKHRAPNWGRSKGRQTLRSEFGENRATNEFQTGSKLEADKL